MIATERFVDLQFELLNPLLGVEQGVFNAIKVYSVADPFQCAGKCLEAYYCVLVWISTAAVEQVECMG